MAVDEGYDVGREDWDKGGFERKEWEGFMRVGWKVILEGLSGWDGV